MTERSRIFIAYCFPEKRWLDRVQSALDTALGPGRCIVWDERKLRAGVAMRSELPEVLANVKVAMMIVSDLFLESDFVTRAKLPAMLERERANGLEICWVLASHCLFELAGIKESDAANRVASALDGLGGPQREAAMSAMARKVAGFLGVEPAPAPAPVAKVMTTPAEPKPVLKKRKPLPFKKDAPDQPPAPALLTLPVGEAVPAISPAAPAPALEPAPAIAPPVIAPAPEEQAPAPPSTMLLSLDEAVQTRQGTVLKLSRLTRWFLVLAVFVALASVVAAVMQGTTHFLFVAGFAAFLAALALRLHALARLLGQGLVGMRYTRSGLADDALPARQREPLLRRAEESLAQN